MDQLKRNKEGKPGVKCRESPKKENLIGLRESTTFLRLPSALYIFNFHTHTHTHIIYMQETIG